MCLRIRQEAEEASCRRRRRSKTALNDACLGFVSRLIFDHPAIHRDAHYPASLLRHTTSWGRALGGSSVGRGRLFFVRRSCLTLPLHHHPQGGRAPEATAIQTSRQQGSKKARPAADS